MNRIPHLERMKLRQERAKIRKTVAGLPWYRRVICFVAFLFTNWRMFRIIWG